PKQHGVDDAEDGGVGADAESERENRGERESGAGAKHSRTKADILDQMLNDRKTAAIAVQLLRLLEPAQVDQRVSARLLRCHAGADVVIDVHLQMAVELHPHLALVPVESERAGETTHERT